MDEDKLADLVARDLRSFLTARASDLAAPAYAVSLWLEFDGDAEPGVSVATEAEFLLQCQGAYRRLSESQLNAPAGLRWDSSGWAVIAEHFLSPNARRSIKTLVRALAGEHRSMPPADGLVRYARVCRGAFMRLGDVPELRTSPDAVAFIEFGDLSVPERGHLMADFVPQPVMARLFPHWNQLARVVAGLWAHPEDLERLQVRRDERLGFPWIPEPADPLLIALQNCGLEFRDVLDRSVRLQDALDLAQRIAS